MRGLRMWRGTRKTDIQKKRKVQRTGWFKACGGGGVGR